jgi:hypothetical protein
VGDARIDIVAKGFDAGIGPRDRASADMIAVRVMGPTKIAVVGAPTHFSKRGPPRTPDDFVRHSCVQLRVAGDGTVLAWPLERNRKSLRISVMGYREFWNAHRTANPGGARDRFDRTAGLARSSSRPLTYCGGRGCEGPDVRARIDTPAFGAGLTKDRRWPSNATG